MAKLPYLVCVENGERSYYKMCSPNHKTMLTSETYKTVRNAERAAAKTAALLGLEVRTRKAKTTTSV